MKSCWSAVQSRMCRERTSPSVARRRELCRESETADLSNYGWRKEFRRMPVAPDDFVGLGRSMPGYPTMSFGTLI